VVAPAQLFAAERLVGSPAGSVQTATVDCRHIGLFMGRSALYGAWPSVARWLVAPGSIAPELDEADAGIAGATHRTLRAPVRTPV
jgi:hypothetical protein